MTQFASVDPVHFEGTIEYDCRVHGPDCYGCVFENEWGIPYEPHNRLSIALLAFRVANGHKTGRDLLEAAVATHSIIPGLVEVGAVSYPQGVHARKVLKRLIRVYGPEF